MGEMKIFVHLFFTYDMHILNRFFLIDESFHLIYDILKHVE
jgi:hypothetical protein